MSEGDVYWERVEPIWEAVSIYDGPKVFLSAYEAAPVVARTLLAAHWCQSETRNGGLSQFFGNGTGVLAPEAIDAFGQIGMPQIAALVKSAVIWFGKEYPRARLPRQRALSAHRKGNPTQPDPFDRHDTEFFRLIDIENGGFCYAADKFALSDRS